ncbi:MAG TPA: hypothetical protein PLE85_10955 [Bacteroidales bacterium]|nr:hypothetical protein [Bacteroidales bacterium]
MDYNELISRIKIMSLSELTLLRDTLAQKIDQVYKMSDPDPESTKADLQDQLMAVMQEIKLRIETGKTDIQPKGPDAPVVTPKSNRPARTVTIRMTPRNIILMLIAAYVIYRIIK